MLSRGFVGFGGRAEWVDLALEPPGPGEVLVAVKAAGLCHTDLWVRNQPRSYVLGHEGAGLVEMVGAGVNIGVGQRVVLNWAMPCGACFQCSMGASHLCERQSPLLALDGWAGPTAPRDAEGNSTIRAFGLGTLATHTVVPESAVWPIGEHVPFASAAILGCGVMTGAGSVFNVADVASGEHAVVIGCGGVGLSVVQALRIVEAGSIIAVDRDPARLDVAVRFGATDAELPDPDDNDLAGVASRVRALTSGRGADHAFECTGVASLATAPLRMVRHGGTAVQISGSDEQQLVDFGLFMFDKTYVSPLYGGCSPARDFPRLLSLYDAGQLWLDEMVTRTYAADAAEEAFADLENGRNVKGVIVLP